MTPEQVAAANLLADKLAAADPAVVEAIVCDASFYLQDADGTVYLAEEAERGLFRLTVQPEPERPAVPDLMEALEASLAAARATLSVPTDPPGEAHRHASPAAPFSEVRNA